MELDFPEIPQRVLQPATHAFDRANGIEGWVKRAFLDEASPVFNPQHLEIQKANILYLWASYDEIRNGRNVCGTAELNRKQVKRWTQGRESFWFWVLNGGSEPDFVITLSAPFFERADPVSRCAVIDHELYHCRHDRDEYGEPKYDMHGEPKWAIQGHDVEEHLGVVRRYGAYDKSLRDMKDALNAKPLIGRPMCAAVCGCGARIGDARPEQP